MVETILGVHPCDTGPTAAEALAGLWPWCAEQAAEPGTLLNEAAKLAWLDWTGVALFGLGTHLGRAVTRVAGDPRQLVPQITAAGVAEISRLALVLGTAAHAAELDDTLPDSMIHAGAPVIAAALAVGLARRSPLSELLGAIAFGYEVAGRLGRAVNAPPRLALHARGFHPTGVVGALGAAAAAGALLGLESERLASALTLAASMGGGVLEFITGGGAAKALHAGKAAADGIIAAALAAEGLAGPRFALEGRDGFLRAYGGDHKEVSALVQGPCLTTAAVVRTQRKYYACCHHCQPSLQILSDLLAAGKCCAENVAAIEAFVPTMAYYQIALPRETKYRPRSTLEAQLSLPYCLAARLVLGHLEPSAFEPPHLTDSRILELTCRVHVEAQKELDGSFSEGRMPAVLRVRLTSGEVLEASAGFETGEFDPAAEKERLYHKWNRLLKRAMSETQARDLWGTLEVEPVVGFAEALRLLRTT